jgi:hypothetical protein
MPGRYEKFVRVVRNHIAFRHFYPERVKILRGSNHEGCEFSFGWCRPGAESGPIPPYTKSAIVVPTLFDASGIEMIEKGTVIFGEGGGEPCDFGLDVGAFAKELSSNNNLTAVLMATSDPQHSARLVRKALTLTQQRLTRAYRSAE